MSRIATRQRELRWLNRFFWLAWFAMGATVVLAAYQQTQFVKRLGEGLTAEQKLGCSGVIPDPSSMNLEGQIVFWTWFAFGYSIYLVIFAILHGLIRRFAAGRVFAAETIATLKTLGIVLIVWPFVNLIAENGAVRFLVARGQMPSWPPNYVVDFGPVAVGLFILALRFVVETAIELQSDNDLTI